METKFLVSKKTLERSEAGIKFLCWNRLTAALLLVFSIAGGVKTQNFNVDVFIQESRFSESSRPLKRVFSPTGNQCRMESIENNIKQLGHGQQKIRSDASKKLIMAAKICKNRDAIVQLYRKNLAEMCSKDEVHGLSKEFRKLEGISGILSEIKDNKSIETLILCVNHSSVEVGLSSAHYPAQEALINFGKSALEPIKENLLHGRSDLKCPLLLLMPGIGGNESMPFLQELRKRESDDVILGCVDSAISAIKR